MEVADWDLHAVVRGCTTASFSSTTTTTTTATTTSPSKSICFSSLFGNTSEQGGLFGQFLPLPDPFEARNAIEDLHDLYKPFFPSKSQDPLVFSHQNQVNSPVSSINEHKQNQQQQCFQVQRANNYKQSQSSSLTNHSGYTPRTKRRKNQLKKVCQVPAEALSSDIWAWRKYGQKPIKGSPYPRGYYRCSSSKGCLARKQVERHRSDPGMFIVTYTAEHNHPAPTHRNSLAGSTRQKAYTPPQTSATTTTDSNNKGSPEKPSCSSPMTSTEDEILASIEGKDMFDDEDDELGGGFSVDTGVSDDFFEGLEELTAPPKSCDVRSSPEHHRRDSIVFPWLSNKDATVASGI